MKFCTECGKKLSVGAKFCGECGTRVGGDSEKQALREILTEEYADILLDDDQSEKVKDVFESFKEDTDCDRIHVVGEDDFDELVSNFAEVFKARSGVENVVETFPAGSIALIDNSKTGHGKRGTLITRMGLFIIDKDYPSIEDCGGEKDGRFVSWWLFAKFAKPFDDESYRLTDENEFNASDEDEGSVEEDEDEDSFEEDSDEDSFEEDEESAAEFFLRFSRTGLTADQIDELVSALKDAVGCDDELDDEDEEDDDEDDYEEEVEEPPTFEEDDDREKGS